MDRAVNIYSPTQQQPTSILPNYLQSRGDIKVHNDRIHYQLSDGFVALDIPQCMNLFFPNDPNHQSDILMGETYGTIALYNAETYNSLARCEAHYSDIHYGEPCVVKLSN